MIWFVMILTGLINFMFRISMFSGIRNIHLPLSLNRYVVYVPTSVLSAIIASSLISFNGQDILNDLKSNEYLELSNSILRKVVVWQEYSINL